MPPMLWIKAFHIIFVVTWFSGLFYLPRLFVYHAMADDKISTERFKIMERKLYYGITTPSAIIATFLGWLLFMDQLELYKTAGWMHAKLAMIFLLWIYHTLCWKFYRDFRADKNTRSHVFYRWFNEFPVLLLIGIVIMVVVRPF